MQERFGYDALAMCRHALRRAQDPYAGARLRLVLDILKDIRAEQLRVAEAAKSSAPRRRGVFSGLLDRRRRRKWPLIGFIRLPF